MNNPPFNPFSHIKSWQATNRKTGQVETILHYPVEWRLYELATQHPEINFTTEIVHLDAQNNFVVVRVSAFVGADYDTSSIKKQSISQGNLNEIDKIESKAQARVARLLGYGTAHALANVPKKPEIDPLLRDRVNALYDRAIALNLAEKGHKSAFIKLIAESIDISIEGPQDLTSEDLNAFEEYLNGMDQ